MEIRYIGSKWKIGISYKFVTYVSGMCVQLCSLLFIARYVKIDIVQSQYCR